MPISPYPLSIALTPALTLTLTLTLTPTLTLTLALTLTLTPSLTLTLTPPVNLAHLALQLESGEGVRHLPEADVHLVRR